MEPKELPANVLQKVSEWLGANPSIKHFWQCDETFMIVATIRGAKNIYCLRIYPVGSSLGLTQDNVLYS